MKNSAKGKFLLLMFFLFYSNVAKSNTNLCDQNFQNLYLAKRSCINDGVQSDCFRLALLSSSLPLVGGASAAIGAKIFNGFVEKSPNLKSLSSSFIEILDANKAIVEVRNKNLLTAADEASVEKKVFGNSLGSGSLTELDKKYTGRDEGRRVMMNDYFQGRMEGKLRFSPQGWELSYFNEMKSRYQKNIEKAIQQTKNRYANVLLKEELAQPGTFHERSIDLNKKVILDSLSKVFPLKDLESALKFHKENRLRLAASYGLDAESYKMYDKKFRSDPNYKKLTAHQKFIYDVVGAGFMSPHASIKKILSNAKTVQDAKKANVTKSALTGAIAGSAGALAPELAGIGMSFLDAHRLEKCESELNFEKGELSFLKGDGYMVPNPKATGQNGVFNFNCTDIRLIDPENVLLKTQSKYNGKIPSGVCSIMKNEMKQFARIEGKSLNMKLDSNCHQFEYAGVKLSNTSKTQTFEYRNNQYILRADWNAEDNYPNFRTAQFFDTNGKRDLKREIKFQDQYNFMHPPSRVEKNLALADISSSCLPDNTGAMDCDLLNAVTNSRMYSSIQESICNWTQSNSENKENHKDANRGAQ